MGDDFRNRLASAAACDHESYVERDERDRLYCTSCGASLPVLERPCDHAITNPDCEHYT